jgi:competence protein ComEC
MIGMVLYLSISVFIYIYQPIVSILFIVFIFYTKSFKYKSLFIIIFLLFVGRTSINLCQPITSGKVVEINDRSIIVNHMFTNVIISVQDVSRYALQDIVTLYELKEIELSYHSYGFNKDYWMKSRNICYKSSEIDTYTVKAEGLLNWLSKGGYNTNQEFIKRLRSLLFQSNPDENLDIFISMGIIYTLIIRLVKLFFLKQKNELFELFFISLIFFYLSIQLAFPLSLIRVWIFYLSSHFVKDRILKFSLNLLICAFINPFGLSQLAFILPLMFQFTALFIPLKSRFIQRTLVILVILLAYNHSISLINILLYPILIVVYRSIIFFTITLAIFPFFNPIYLYGLEVIDYLNRISFEYFLIKGHVSLVFIIVCVLIYHFTNRYKRIQIIVMLFFVLFGSYLFSVPFFYTVTMINVGQGDSILIQAPFNQKVVLIDTGSIYNYHSLKTYLDAQSIRIIDVLIITHDDSDHSGNIETLSKDYEIKDIVLKGKDINLDSLYLDYLEFKQTYYDDNDSSLIYSMNLINTRFLFMGDLSVKGEYQLIQNYPHLKTDILKIGHHGSKSSTSDELLELIQPRIGLISVGTNYYGHPSALIMQKLSDYHIKSLSSMHEGDIRIILFSFFDIIISSKNDYYFTILLH